MKWDGLSDVELVKRFKAGDSLAYDEIMRRFQDRVFRLASVWLYDNQLAADVAQEVFVRGFKGLQKFRFQSDPFTWLYRTTRNVCHEFNRSKRTEVLDEEPADEDSIPEKQVISHDTAQRVRTLIDRLPERQREVVMLRIFEDLSVKETSLAMGCREGTVKALLHKAINKMKLTGTSAGLTDD